MRKFTIASTRIVLALALVVGISTAEGAIVANFTGGAGSASVDQYPGIGGDGWTTAWVENNDTNVFAEILSGSQLNGGGNYLSITNTVASSNGVRRSYETTGEVDLTQPHVIRFDWRFSGNYDHFNAVGDRFYIGDGSIASGGQGSSTAFNIRAHGDERDTANAKEWAVYNGTQDGGSVADDHTKWVNTGMLMEHNVVYAFTITVDPANLEYDVSIFNGTTTVAVNDMGFNKLNANPLTGVLFFMSNKSTSADSLTFGFDSVSISAVPEPTSLGLASCAAAIMGLVSRRGRRSSC